MDKVLLVLVMVGKVLYKELGLLRGVLVNPIELFFKIQRLLISLLPDQAIIHLIPTQ